MQKELVSIIIPAYNESAVIGRLLRSIKKQSYKRLETIVVDDSSTDQTAEIARRFTRRVFTRPHGERSVQRNFGAREAKGKYLLFLDADMKLTKHVVKDCIALMDTTPKCGGVVIPEKSVAENFWEKVKAYERSFYNLEKESAIEAARFFKTDVFWKVGGYDENITGPEDWDLPESIRKKGYELRRVDSYILHYERIPGIISLIKKKYYYAQKAHKYLDKQNIPLISAKTVYFLRPVFLRNWKILVRNPLMTAAMFVMFILELAGGVAGYLKGKYLP